MGGGSPTVEAPGRSWIAPAVAVVVSLLLHGLLAAAPLVVHRREDSRDPLLWFKVVAPPRRRAKPVAEKKVQPPPRPRPRSKHPPRPVAVHRSPETPSHTPPPPPVFGATKESVTDGEANFSVPLGNTLATDPTRRGPVQEGVPEAGPLPPPPPPQPGPKPVTVRTHPRLLQEVKVPYPARARALGIEGTVRVRVLVGADGTVRRALLLSGPGFGLDEAARTALLRFRFHPAIGSDGRPMACWITYQYAFENRE